MKKHFCFTLIFVFIIMFFTGSAYGDDGSICSISFNGSEAVIEGFGAGSDGNIVTVYSAGSYRLSGSFEGQLIVDASLKKGAVTLIFDSVSLSCAQAPALWIENARNGCTILLEENTESFISCFSGDEAVYSAAALDITGSGSLGIESQGDGIFCRKSIDISGANISINSAARGMHSSKSISLDGCTLSISSVTEGIDAKNNIDILSGSLNIVSGTDCLEAGERGDSYKEDGGVISIYSGSIVLDSYSSPIDANGCLNLYGGTVWGTGREDNCAAVTVSEGTACVSCEISAYAGDEIKLVNQYSGTLASGSSIYHSYYAFFASPDLKSGTNYYYACSGSSYFCRAN